MSIESKRGRREEIPFILGGGNRKRGCHRTNLVQMIERKKIV
jgi:hypothetical protein